MTQQVLADIEVDAALCVAYAAEARRLTGAPVGLASLVAKAAGRALRVLRRPGTDVLLVSGGQGLAVAVAGDAPVVEIAARFEDGRTGTVGAVIGAEVIVADRALPHAYPPLRSRSAAPIAIEVGVVQERVVAVAGHVVCRPMLTLTLAADASSFATGELGMFATAVRDYLSNPRAFEPPFGVGTGQAVNEAITSAG